MRVLVTGGAGYIGSHVCKALPCRGLSLTVYDSLVTGNAGAVQWSRLVEGSLSDRQAVVCALLEAQADSVLHFAASAYVGESMRDPGKYFRNNVASTLNLLEAMVEAGVKRIVFSSSCATYGVPDRLPITEDTPQRPVNAYGESKLMCERLIRWFAECHGMQYVILRYFNAAGADPEGEIGECHDPEPHLIPIVLRAVSEGRPVTIYGTDYPTPDGTAIRDYVHVSDLARAHVLAAEHLLRGGESLAVNLGTGKGHSVLEVIRTAEKVVGHRAEIEIASRRLGDPAMLVASNASAKQTLGWAPEYPELRTMMEHALRFSELRW